VFFTSGGGGGGGGGGVRVYPSPLPRLNSKHQFLN